MINILIVNSPTKRILIISIIGVFQKVSSFLLVPLYVNLVDKELLGISTSSLASLSLIILITAHGQEELLVKYYHDKNSYEKEIRTHFTIGLIIISTISFMIFSIIPAKILGIPSYLYCLAIPYSILFPYYSLGLKVLKIRNKLFHFATIQLLYIILQFCLFFRLIKYGNRSTESIFALLTIPTIITGLFFIFYLSRNSLGKPEIELWKKGSKTSINLLLHNISGWFLTGFVIYSISALYSDTEAAVIFTIFTLGSLFTFGTKTILDSIQPILYDLLKTKKTLKPIVFARYLSVLFSGFGGIYFIVAPIIYKQIFPEYADTNQVYIFAFILSSILLSLTSITVFFFYYNKEAKILSLSTFFSATISVLFSLSFYKFYGPIIFIIGINIGYLSSLLIRLSYLKRIYNVGIFNNSTTIICSVFILFSLLNGFYKNTLVQIFSVLLLLSAIIYYLKKTINEIFY